MAAIMTLKKAEVFQKLHERERIFVLPNPWDIGTAKILTALGFEALATTSAATVAIRMADSIALSM